MKKLVLGIAALPFLAGIAMAGQLTPLTDAQMDKVIAGLEIVVFPNFLGFGPGFEINQANICSSPGCIFAEFPSADGVANRSGSFPLVRGFPNP